jgi:hypothetical protein
MATIALPIIDLGDAARGAQGTYSSAHARSQRADDSEETSNDITFQADAASSRYNEVAAASPTRAPMPCKRYDSAQGQHESSEDVANQDDLGDEYREAQGTYSSALAKSKRAEDAEETSRDITFPALPRAPMPYKNSNSSQRQRESSEDVAAKDNLVDEAREAQGTYSSVHASSKGADDAKESLGDIDYETKSKIPVQDDHDTLERLGSEIVDGSGDGSESDEEASTDGTRKRKNHLLQWILHLTGTSPQLTFDRSKSKGKSKFLHDSKHARTCHGAQPIEHKILSTASLPHLEGTLSASGASQSEPSTGMTHTFVTK